VTTRPPASLTLLRDACVVAAVAVVAFQVLRRWVGDRSQVDSGSMQPCLYGDPERGDVIYLDKLARAEDRRRGDIVVVRHPRQPGELLVKRVAARGDDADACWVDLRDGDVWLGPDRQHLRLDRKEPLAARALRVPWARWAGGAVPVPKQLDLRAARCGDGVCELQPAEAVGEALRVVFGELARRNRRRDPSGGVLPSGAIGTARAVDGGYLDAEGVPRREGDDARIWDCGIDAWLDGPCDEVLCCVENRAVAAVFRWQPTSGALELWADGRTVARATLPVPTGAHRIEFGRLDGRYFFAADGRLATDCLVAHDDMVARADDPGPEPRSHAYLLAAGRRAVAIRSLVVFRDVFALRMRIAGLPGQPGEWPRFVAPDHWFLLGDNAFDSTDSRSFDAVPAAAFVGRPLAVLGPWSRCRWLVP
jgi:hypothetical protein